MKLKPYQLLLLLITLISVTSAQSAEKPPNVLMFAVDDLRPMLGCYGDSRVTTPNIDRIAARGMLFERAYCQYAKCGTSRLSLMTGLRPDSVGVFSNRDTDVKAFRKRRPDAISFVRFFKNSGYDTRGFGKIYHDGWDNPDDWSVPTFPGRDREMWEVFDLSDPKKESTIAERWACPVLQNPDVNDDQLFAGRMTRKVLEALGEDREAPFFLSVGFRRPHLPFVAPKKYFDLYEPDSFWLAKNTLPPIKAPIMAWFTSDGYVGGAKRLGLEMPLRPNRDQAVNWNGFEMRSYFGVPNVGEIPLRQQLKLLQAYAACITYVDAQIGRVLDELKARKLDENTIIVFWSDHGWHLGEHSVWGKMTNYEIATRVPFIISSPKHKTGRTKSFAELVDLYPTLCHLAGLKSPLHIEGKSLVPVLENPENTVREFASSQYARFKEKFMGYAIRTERFRYVEWYERNSGEIVDRELYDHNNDPGETQNLAGENQYTETMVRLHKLVGKPGSQ